MNSSKKPIEIYQPICGYHMIEKTLTGRTIECPKCKNPFTFSYDVVIVKEKSKPTNQRFHSRGHKRGAHRGDAR